MSTTTVEVPFAAPVPRGHEVLIATLRQAPDSEVRATLVFDRTATITYCPESLWGPLSGPVGWTDPVAALTRFTWRVEDQKVGRVVAARVATSPTADRSPVHTRLLVEPTETSPYR